MLRKEGMEYWIQRLREMKDEGLFVGDYLDKSLVQLCFRNIIQVRLRRFMWTALPSLEQICDVFMMLNKAQTLTVIFVTLLLFSLTEL